MDAQTQAELKAHTEAIAEILRREANPEAIKTFKGIEYTVRDLTREYVMPELGNFFVEQQQQQKPGEPEKSSASSET